MPTAIKNSKIDITSEKSTRELAEKLTSYFKGGEYIFLYGEMGVGKTTFVKYFVNKSFFFYYLIFFEGIFHRDKLFK